MQMPLIIAIGGGAVVAAAAAAMLALSLPNGVLSQAPQQIPTQPGAQPMRAAPGERQTSHEEFADWALICTEGAESKSCAIIQNHVHGETRERLFTVQLRRMSRDAVNVALITPLQVFLRQGIILQVDELEPVQIPFSECRPGLCQATAQLSNEFVGRLVRSQEARAAYQTAGGQTVTVNISHDGLAEALAALERGAGQ